MAERRGNLRLQGWRGRLSYQEARQAHPEDLRIAGLAACQPDTSQDNSL